MTFWEFAAAVQGWAKANSVGDETQSSLTEAEHDALMAKYA